MKRGHLTRRPPMPGKRFTWARVPLGDSGMVCYRLFRRDVDGVQRMAAINCGRGLDRRHIAHGLRRERYGLLETVDALDFRKMGVSA